MTREQADELAAKTPGTSTAQVKRGKTIEGKEILYLDMPDGDWEMVSSKPGLKLLEGDWCVVRKISRDG